MSLSQQSTNIAGRIIGWIISIILTLCGLGFYYAHQAWSTGFFTASFSTELAVLLYVSVFYVAVNATAKLLTDRKSTVLAVELIGAFLTSIATLALFVALIVSLWKHGKVPSHERAGISLSPKAGAA